MEGIRRYIEEARIELDKFTVELWALTHDKGWRYGAMTTNCNERCVEPIHDCNGALKGMQSLSITAMVSYTFFKLVSCFDDRRSQNQT
jgi:hypothetical protein